MPQLLLEILSEEIPARMQAKAETDLREALVGKLKAAGLEGTDVKAMSGPRRLTVVVDGLPARSADVEEERKGPRTDAPAKAIEGFLRGAGLASVDEAKIVSDPKKGDFYVAVKRVPGRDTADVVAEAVPEIIRGFHWPKSMRSGTGELRWVRPLRRILCVFDGKVVDFEVDGLRSGNVTEGHRVHGPGPFEVSDFASYAKILSSEGHVRLTREERKTLIADQARAACKAKGLELVEDEGLLEEVTGLAEWPVVVVGDMDPAFLDLPDEVIQLSMRTHQKYFAVRDPKKKVLSPHFVVVANIEAVDGGEAIAAGNRRVLSARLNDARFFWDIDRKKGLEPMAPKLKTIDFKKELGSIADKVDRVAALARELAPVVGADADLADRAARLAKADLISEMVFEFPELQGVMGRYYALAAGEDAAVADAIRDHYKPQGPSDAVPTDPVSVAVALADKLDTLVGFWAIDEKPTGSKDPFALRRAALGVIRIVLENEVRLEIKSVISDETYRMIEWLGEKQVAEEVRIAEGLSSLSSVENLEQKIREWPGFVEGISDSASHSAWQNSEDLLAFFADRLKVHLREQGVRHDLIDAVFALGEDDLVLIVKRVEALQAFLGTEAGAALLAGYKRAANILKAEEKKGFAAGDRAVDPARFVQEEETELFARIRVSRDKADAALQQEDFAAAMSALSDLRAPVDRFFEGVTVNADEEDLRTNRLLLLGEIRDALHRVADFSRIEG